MCFHDFFTQIDWICFHWQWLPKWYFIVPHNSVNRYNCWLDFIIVMQPETIWYSGSIAWWGMGASPMPMPTQAYALCPPRPMPTQAYEHFILLRKAIPNPALIPPYFWVRAGSASALALRQTKVCLGSVSTADSYYLILNPAPTNESLSSSGCNRRLLLLLLLLLHC